MRFSQLMDAPINVPSLPQLTLSAASGHRVSFSVNCGHCKIEQVIE
jgi:hypothetical protein